MLDLDHFKLFNDRHGHEAGNALLHRLGATLRETVRGADVAARYGGEEFAVLIRGDEQRGYELAERLRRAVAATPVDGRSGAEVSAPSQPAWPRTPPARPTRPTGRARRRRPL